MAKRRISRRRFLEKTGTAIAVAPVAQRALTDGVAQGFGPASVAQPGGASAHAITLTVNGARKRVDVDPRWTLAEVLRDHLGLTGTKIGCDRGECGACTVLLDGKNVYSCSQLAVWADGHTVLTVEGLAQNGKLDPLQEAFIQHDGP